MYTEMRRKDRAISDEEAREILAAGEYGVLSTVSAEGLPAGVPLSYIVDGDAVCFHCAKQGEKIANLHHQPKVSFVVVGKVQAVYLGDYTTYYESAVVHGVASPVAEDGEKTRLLRLLCEKYLPEHMDKFDDALRSLPATDVWRISIDRLTGKAKR